VIILNFIGSVSLLFFAFLTQVLIISILKKIAKCIKGKSNILYFSYEEVTQNLLHCKVSAGALLLPPGPASNLYFSFYFMNRLYLFPCRKESMPFLTVDAIVGNQAYQNGRCYYCFFFVFVLGLDKVKTGYNLLMELNCSHQMLDFSYSHWFDCG